MKFPRSGCSAVLSPTQLLGDDAGGSIGGIALGILETGEQEWLGGSVG